MRLVKALGLAAVVALSSMALLAASSASAAQFKAEEYPATFSGEELTTQEITTNSGKMKCNRAMFTGSEAAASASLALTTSYLECTFAGVAMTISWNSCHLAFNSTNGTPPYTGTMDLVCVNEGDALKIGVGGIGCVIEFPAQSGLSGVSYENVGSGATSSITTALNVTGISYTESKKCLSPGAHTNGTYKGSFSLQGLNSKEEANGVFIG